LQIYENSEYLQTKRTKNSRNASKNDKRPRKESIFSEAFERSCHVPVPCHDPYPSPAMRGFASANIVTGRRASGFATIEGKLARSCHVPVPCHASPAMCVPRTRPLPGRPLPWVPRGWRSLQHIHIRQWFILAVLHL
jgi:hypothetical protein